MRPGLVLALYLCATPLALGTASPPAMVLLPAGTYLPLFSEPNRRGDLKAPEVKSLPVEVSAFLLDRRPVTNLEFLDFTMRHPEWRRSRVSSLFSESQYLKHWKNDSRLASVSDGARPVTFVSWFSARAYCESRGDSLPTNDQWEYALADQGRSSFMTRDKILRWYSSPNSKVLAPASSGGMNGFGIQNLYGLVWEWTLDFNGTLIGDESFCGGGAQNALDASDYSAFMRYSFRGSLKAKYVVGNLGFRCARKAG